MDPGKLLLIRFGSLSGEKTSYFLNTAIDYFEVGRWMTNHGFSKLRRVGSRTQLFEMVSKDIADKNVLYLEFGVAAGDSMRIWSQLLKNRHSHLDGFDSFEGLPVNWTPLIDKGSYSTEGVEPCIPDSRVSFVKGLFEDTLVGYTPPDHDVLFINVDCDVYSSAALVLQRLRDFICPGTYLYFDEFADRSNEMKAFDDFLVLTGMQFRVVAATKTLRRVCFQRVS